MANTYIDTNKIPAKKLPGSGEFAEILNKQLAGAENVVATLRWLNPGDSLEFKPDAATHQLIYVMEGKGIITLDSKDHPVAKGNGMYLGPGESSRITHKDHATLKLFHLVVPKQS